MRLEAKTRLQAATFTFQDKVANPMERSYLLVTVHGKDGASNTVCTGQKPNGFFCVFVVSSKGQLLAESAMNMVKVDAFAMAKHAVATKAKVYQDEDSVFDRYTSLLKFKYMDTSRERITFTASQVAKLWELLNATCFSNALSKPSFVIQRNLKKRVSDFIADYNLPAHADTTKQGDTLGLVLWDFKRNQATIVIDTSVDNPKDLMMVLAHEMVHQALAEKHGYQKMCVIAHGPEFKAYKANIERYKGLKLTGEDFLPI